MRYSSLLVAVSAFVSFAAAQENSTGLPPGIEPCCEVDPANIPDSDKRDWCLAERNTCREACDGQVASGGNTCDDDTLEFKCECRNDNVTMSDFEQSVPGQMCRYWFQECINATDTSEDLDQQEACQSAFDENCGTEVTQQTTGVSSNTAEATATTTSGGSENEAATTSGGEPTGTGNAAPSALAFARDYGTPLMAGGLMAVFGIAL